MIDAERQIEPEESAGEVESDADPDLTGERLPEGDRRGDPLAALVKERQRNRSDISGLQVEIAELKRNLTPAQQAEADAWENPYDRDERPFDWLAAETQHTRELLNQTTKQTREQQTQAANAKAIDDFGKSAWAEIQAAGKAFEAAYGHVEQLMIATHGDDAFNKLIEVIAKGVSKGKDAPTVIAEIAMKTGYKTPPAAGPDAKVRAARASQASLGGATGGTGSAKITMEQLAKLPRAEMAKPENRERLAKALRGDL